MDIGAHYDDEYSGVTVVEQAEGGQNRIGEAQQFADVESESSSGMSTADEDDAVDFVPNYQEGQSQAGMSEVARIYEWVRSRLKTTETNIFRIDARRRC